jgi:hypothetical protein
METSWVAVGVATTRFVDIEAAVLKNIECVVAALKVGEEQRS